jgi:hypothetical protein
MLDEERKAESEMASLNASQGLILGAEEDKLLLSIDDKLVLVEGGKQKTVLKSHRSRNFFWHATRAENMVFVQEYGEAPTGIFASEDLMNWRKLVVNTSLDKHSKHFHNITYDPYRKWLIATLGDGCLTRVVVSEDLGNSWKPLYRGPWQFVPAVPLQDKIVFGMDSGIAKGGLGIYYLGEDKWSFVFLKSLSHRRAQFASLKKFGDYYIGCLGYPTAIVVSRDLRHWHLLHLDNSHLEYNYFVDVEPWGEKIVAVTGKELLVFELKDVEKAFEERPFLTPHRAYLDRLRGLAFTIKRIRWMLKP